MQSDAKSIEDLLVISIIFEMVWENKNWKKKSPKNAFAFFKIDYKPKLILIKKNLEKIKNSIIIPHIILKNEILIHMLEIDSGLMKK
jgi:hypothetical protein